MHWAFAIMTIICFHFYFSLNQILQIIIISRMMRMKIKIKRKKKTLNDHFCLLLKILSHSKNEKQKTKIQKTVINTNIKINITLIFIGNDLFFLLVSFLFIIYYILEIHLQAKWYMHLSPIYLLVTTNIDISFAMFSIYFDLNWNYFECFPLVGIRV